MNWSEVDQGMDALVCTVAWRVRSHGDWAMQEVRGVIRWPQGSGKPVLKESSFTYEPPADAVVKVWRPMANRYAGDVEIQSASTDVEARDTRVPMPELAATQTEGGEVSAT